MSTLAVAAAQAGLCRAWNGLLTLLTGLSFCIETSFGAPEWLLPSQCLRCAIGGGVKESQHLSLPTGAGLGAPSAGDWA